MTNPKTGATMSREELLEFLYNKENIGNCKECPYNYERFYNNNKLPCGQYNCWVELHCGGE